MQHRKCRTFGVDCTTLCAIVRLLISILHESFALGQEEKIHSRKEGCKFNYAQTTLNLKCENPPGGTLVERYVCTTPKNLF